MVLRTVSQCLRLHLDVSHAMRSHCRSDVAPLPQTIEATSCKAAPQPKDFIFYLPSKLVVVVYHGLKSLLYRICF